MAFWEPLEFGPRALLLKSTIKKSREEIDEITRNHLERLISHAQAHSEYWGDKLGDIQDSSFELTDLPTSSKPELMENFDATITVDDVTRDDAEEFFENPRNFGKLFRDKYVLSHTSGSQGQPLIIVQPEDNLELLFALQVARGNTAPIGILEAVKHLISPAPLAAVILNPGFYPSASAFAYMPDSAKRFLEVQLSVEDDHMLEHLAEFRPTHLTAYSSVLHEIARAIEAGKLDLKPELTQVVNISERLMPQARKHYEEVFGAAVLDDYGMGECMFLTNGCSASHGMHVNADWAILEVVDKDNQPIPAGKKGVLKVLITNLANYVQPVIRYEVGDIVTMATRPCGCGNNMPLIDHIDGRDSDIFHIETESGTRPLQPTIFELAIGQMLDAREYQIVQEENTKFRIRVEPLPGKRFNRERGEKIMSEALMEYKLTDKVEVKIECVERLTADGDKKFKRIVSKVKRDEQKR